MKKLILLLIISTISLSAWSSDFVRSKTRRVTISEFDQSKIVLLYQGCQSAKGTAFDCWGIVLISPVLNYDNGRRETLDALIVSQYLPDGCVIDPDHPELGIHYCHRLYFDSCRQFLDMDLGKPSEIKVVTNFFYDAAIEYKVNLAGLTRDARFEKMKKVRMVGVHGEFSWDNEHGHHVIPFKVYPSESVGKPLMMNAQNAIKE